MIIDNKGRLFGKVSIIDVIIVLVIVLSVAGILYKFEKTKIAGPFNSDKVVMEFFVEEVPEFVVESVSMGEHARNKLKNSDLGVITEIKIDKSISWSQNEKGELTKSTKAGYNSLAISVEGIGVYSEAGIVIDGGDYFIGQKLSLKIKDAMFDNMIIRGMHKKE